MKNLYILVFILIFSSLSAQERIYLNENWRPTTKEKASFYRETSKEGKLIRIKDFYINGKLQMEGLASKIEVGDEVLEGEIKWFDEEGNLEKVGNYKNGKRIGVEKEFYPDGRISKEDFPKLNGEIHATEYVYKDQTGGYNKFTEWKDGHMIETTYDEDIKLIRDVQIGVEDFEFYDEKGKLIGKLNDDYSKGKNGTEVLYFYNPMKVKDVLQYKDGQQISSKSYFPNGVLEREINSIGTIGTFKKYDRSGKLIAQNTSQVTEEGSFPIDGTYALEEYLDETGNLSYVKRFATYKDGKIVNRKFFYENGKIETEETPKEVTRYKLDGSVQHTMLYQNEKPFDGVEIIDNKAIIKYKNAKLLFLEYYIDELKTLGYNVIFNDKINRYEQKIFDGNSDYKLLKYLVTTKEAESYEDEGAIITYQNGKPIAEAVLKNELLQSGKVIFFDDKKAKTIFETEDGIYTKITTYDENGELVTSHSFSNTKNGSQPKIKIDFLLNGNVTIPTVTYRPEKIK